MSAPIFPYNEEYVVPGGAGANDGTSWADAWDVTQGVAAQDKRLNFAGDFACSGTMPWSGNGNSLHPIALRGWKPDKSAPAVVFSECPIFDFSGSSGNNAATSGTFHHWQGLRLLNGPQHGIYNYSNSYSHYDLVECTGMTNTGIQIGTKNKISRCRFKNNGQYGIAMGDYGTVAMSEVVGNSLDGLNLGTLSQAILCYITRNSRYGAYFINGGAAIGCTVDANQYGLYNNGVNTSFSIIASILSNNTVAAVHKAYTMLLDHVCFHGNASYSSEGSFLGSLNEFNEDPQYTDISNDDYSIANPNLLNLDIPVLGNMNIGAWQSGGGGGGRRPRIRLHGA